MGHKTETTYGKSPSFLEPKDELLCKLSLPVEILHKGEKFSEEFLHTSHDTRNLCDSLMRLVDAAEAPTQIL